MTVLEALQATPLLAGATEDDLERVAAISTSTHHDAGSLLLRAGDAADRCHLLVRGRVALTLPVPGRGDLVAETLGAGDVVGVSWARPAQRWDLDGRAITEVDTVTVDGDRLRALMDIDDHLGRVLRHGAIGLLAERLHSTRLRLLDLYREELRS